MNKLLIIIFILITSVVSQSNTDYFPLEIGNKWEYLLLEKTKVIVTIDYFSDKHKAYYLSQRTFMDDLVVPLEKFLRLENEKSGGYKIVCVGSKDFLSNKWRYEKYTELKLPFVVGNKWVNNDGLNRYEVLEKLNMNVSGTVYYDVYCVKLINQDDVIYYEYYAPGVGLILRKAKFKSRDEQLISLRLINFTKATE